MNCESSTTRTRMRGADMSTVKSLRSLRQRTETNPSLIVNGYSFLFRYGRVHRGHVHPYGPFLERSY